jgi:hypothetical protein
MGPRTAGALVLLAALVLALPAAGAPPTTGEFVTGKSLAGIRLGMTKQEVRTAWGTSHGVCRKCPETTWYFNYEPFAPQGAGVVFREGRVAHVFTIWRPIGWKTTDGLALGADVSEVSRHYGSLDRRDCDGYYALLDREGHVASAFYVFRDKVWGFGLLRENASPCL